MRKTSIALGIVIILLSFYYAFSDVSLEELQNAFLSLHYTYLIPAVFLIALSFIFRAMRWRYLIRAVKEVKTADLFSPLIVGFMGNMLPARAGEFIRAYLLGKRANISFSASFATIIIERLFDLAMILILLSEVLLFNSYVFSQGGTGAHHKFMSYIFTFGWISFTLCMLIFAFSVFLQYKNDLAMKTVAFCTKPLSQKWGAKITTMVISFNEGFNIVRDKRGFIMSSFFSFLILLTVVFYYYPLYFAFGIEGNLPIISSLTILCLTTNIFVALFPTPGFLGAYQAACVFALHEIFYIPKAIAVSYGIVAWLGSMGIIIIAGAFFVIKDNISIGKIAVKKQITSMQHSSDSSSPRKDS